MHKRFVDLHTGDDCLLMPNAWDAASAMLQMRAGAQAIGTSSAAMAWASGYADGGALPKATLLEKVRAILRVVHVPLSVDIEDGYDDDPEAVAGLVHALVSMGVAGINLEDGAGLPEQLEAKLQAIRRRLSGSPLYINARTDVYLRSMTDDCSAVEMAVERLRGYRQAGADGAFVPGIGILDAIRAIADAVSMPLNVMAIPGLPPVDSLRLAGVRRLSAGPALFVQAYGSGFAMAKQMLAGEPMVPSPAKPDYFDYNTWLS